MSRLTLKITIAAVLVIILVIAELIRLNKRRNTRKEANALGKDEYLIHLKTRYRQLKTEYNSSSSNKERANLLREMEKVENKIIQLEED